MQISKKNLRIIFMGTPDFAVASLKSLIENDFNIVGVITMPDKPAGRGHKMQYSQVKEYALSQNLNLLQPTNLKDSEFIESLKALKPDLQIVVAFRMLPEIVWRLPKLGTFNLHASLLPQYRGAAPINWAIINGETETGITTFFLNSEIDKGEIIAQIKVAISEKDNAKKIHDELMIKGAALVVDTVNKILKGEAISQSQEKIETNGELKPAPKIFKETCRINWNKSPKAIYNFIRGLSPHPAAWTICKKNNGEEIVIKILESNYIYETHDYFPGYILTDNKKYFRIACLHGFIDVTAIQLPGKKVMDIKNLLNGYKFEEGVRAF